MKTKAIFQKPPNLKGHLSPISIPTGWGEANSRRILSPVTFKPRCPEQLFHALILATLLFLQISFLLTQSTIINAKYDYISQFIWDSPGFYPLS